MADRKHGDKYEHKYNVASSQIYKNDPGPDKLIIPPPGHFLHDESSPTVVDEQKVKQIEEDGFCSAIIEVWTDKDKSVQYVLDGRETLATVREVNCRRLTDGREPIQIRMTPVSLSEKDAVAHVAVRNFHRRNTPSPTAYALNIRMQRRAGWSWDKVCDFLLVKAEHPEKWCRSRLPLAFAVKEVRAAFDAGEFPLALALQFGGRDVDGSDALGPEEQLALLEQKRAEKLQRVGKPRAVPAAARKRVRAALLNGETRSLCTRDADAAMVAAATIAFLDGDASAFAEWPEVRAIMEKAVAKKSLSSTETAEESETES